MKNGRKLERESDGQLLEICLKAQKKKSPSSG